MTATPPFPVCLGAVDGVDINLIYAWADESGVHLALEAEPSDRTRALDAAFDRDAEEWTAVRAQRGQDAAGRPPRPPGARLLELAIGVSDDAGMQYKRASVRAAGIDSRWNAMIHFDPPPPAGVQRLLIAAEQLTQPLILDLD